jgi:ankyrin repeat protein
VLSCNPAAVRVLLDAHADVNACTSRGSPLHLAARAGCVAVMEALLAAGADVHLRDRDGPCVHAAVSDGRGDVVEILEDMGYEAAVAGSALAQLLEQSASDAVGLLTTIIDAKADLSATNAVGDTPLMHAVRCNNDAAVAMLLRADGPVDQRNHHGATALFTASRHGTVAAITALLAAGADPNIADRGGASCVFAAVAAGRAEVLRALIDAKADVNYCRGGGAEDATALDMANDLESAEVVAMLQAAGAQTWWSIGPSVVPLVARALSADEPPSPPELDEASDGDKHAALVYAVDRGRRDLVSALLAAGVSPNCQRGRRTPLVLASGAGLADVVAQLLDARADVALRDGFGRTAVQAAAAGKHRGVVELLLARAKGVKRE